MVSACEMSHVFPLIGSPVQVLTNAYKELMQVGANRLTRRNVMCSNWYPRDVAKATRMNQSEGIQCRLMLLPRAEIRPFKY